MLPRNKKKLSSTAKLFLKVELGMTGVGSGVCGLLAFYAKINVLKALLVGALSGGGIGACCFCLALTSVHDLKMSMWEEDAHIAHPPLPRLRLPEEKPIAIDSIEINLVPTPH